MSQTLPTTYDILGLPNYAWEPGPLWWLGLIGLGLVAALIPILIRKRKSTINAWNLGNEELARISKSNQSGLVQLALLSAITKRLIGLTEKQDISGLSPSELAALAQATNEPLNKIYSNLAEIDRQRYANRAPEQHSITDKIAEIRELLSTYWQAQLAKQKDGANR